jgi:hypothetical protein
MKLKQIQGLLKKVGSIVLLDHVFICYAFYDKKAYPYMKTKSRIYIQITYCATCIKTKEYKLWTGRKFYLSDHMTVDEIIKTCFVAFKTAVEHEVMESFKVEGKTLFNPHVNYKELLSISEKEVNREAKTNQDGKGKGKRKTTNR